ncbi:MULTISPECIES: hypothetical protein [unclassified Lentimonas]|uniref:hypothetical protein n=1 Tax=unclassified Lentimonas TaxID=2630993 RepID=UPI001329F812|nr:MULTISPECIES: hypothetical protein [unclassified Lentimonas]CAA6678048.1 Unannotated [Lentimonas sp. CC4]CAA6687022.1 Unannotated [Lentimonas sp. CC6]CAA7075865.1 Unannotated [Lentimonas sp. CC4]CAA7172009.1 Unannotated [Lentimonas sp. CC21]CAA7182928.1 Unannotated [Lentimonas sp. CC8]
MKAFITLTIVLCSCVPALGSVARILCYDKPSNAPDVVYIYVDSQLHGEVELPKLKFGEDIELKASGSDLQIVLSPKIIEKGQELPSELPSIKVSKDWKKFLIIVIEDKNNEALPIKPFAINANDDYFGNKDFLFINLSPNYVVGTFGDKVIELEPQKIQVEKMSAYSGEFLDAKLDYVRPDDNGKRRWMVYKGWRVLPDRRTLVFCYPQSGRTTMKYFATQVKNM